MSLDFLLVVLVGYHKMVGLHRVPGQCITAKFEYNLSDWMSTSHVV